MNEEIAGKHPYERLGPSGLSRTIWVLGSLAVLAFLYAWLYLPVYAIRFALTVLAGVLLEGAYRVLGEGRFHLRLGGSALTAALLVLSVPPDIPFFALLCGLVVAIVVVRLPHEKGGIHLNPMLVGRLFMMMAFNEQIVEWTKRGADMDAVTTATPLELLHSEGVALPLGQMLRGHIDGSWEGLYEMVPGSPGDVFIPVIVLAGIILAIRGVLQWRIGIAFLVSFAAACAIIGEPVLFNVCSGAAIFSAVFIAGDPISTPASRSGQVVAGLIAGIINAVIRTYTFYSEGIVFAFLAINLLAPTLDRIAFAARGSSLLRRQRRFRAAARSAGLH